ncbi:hypothetical protein C5S31_02150 [ANME-1 cluster archaeon GoMg2]|nr:hypothetical protein [ANME-1 cluster archaeon GoMg2]
MAKKMKKVLNCIVVTAAMLLIVASMGSASGSELILEDNFESYSVGSYLSSPWYNIWSGDTAYVSDSYAYSGSKSFYSKGKPNWARTDAVQIEPNKQIAYEVAVYATAYPTDAHISLYNKDISDWGTHYADIRFLDGKIYARGGGANGIAEYQTNTWYKVKVEADFDTQKMDVYINGALLGNQLNMGGTSGEALYNTFTLGAEHSSGNSGVYFDDVKIYAEGTAPESLLIDVWTDKSKYNIGETVTIYYQTNTACTAKLTVTKPDGTQVVVGGPDDIPVCTRSKSAAAGYPTGTRTVTFEAWTSDESKEATCYFNL